MRRSRFALVVAVVALASAVSVPAAFAVGWVAVPAGYHDQPINAWPIDFSCTYGCYIVNTANPVYSSNMRLYVQTPPGTGISNNTVEGYLYPSGGWYAYGYFQPWESTPDYLGVAGGNKFALCSHQQAIPNNPLATCQRYSTT